MAFLRLQNIGKIYVSEGNVAVGIRGVNLSFEKGEFVAITGASGSGKSTLLNVLSGMDTYEEGELFIEEQPTSHYMQPDWEEYREKYISFIFQDYNIIDSFTVLQNVELALMTIPDPAKRRRRAIELIERVGLSKHMKHKGSQLSGGQKQRTVIARALAKDSPIILADEPTGNLDSETSKEIIELMREISRDKLLIMVTHSFDQVETVATRHIRVFDGAIESDRVLCVDSSSIETEGTEAESEGTKKDDEAKEVNRKLADVSNGVLLGRSMFFAKPKLSIFLCVLMIVGIFGIFAATAVCGDFAEIFHTYRLFRKEEGRLIVAHKDGTGMKSEEIEALAKEYNAKDWLYFDLLMDIPISDPNFRLQYGQLDYHNDDSGEYVCAYDKDFGKPDIGRYPESSTEILLNLPVYYKPLFGEDSIKVDKMPFFGDTFSVVGIKYYADTSVMPTMLFTREGFKYATCLYIAYDSLYFGYFVGGEEHLILKYWAGGKYDAPKHYFVVKVNRNIDPDAVIVDNLEFQKDVKEDGYMELTLMLATSYQYNRKVDYTLSNPVKQFFFEKVYKLEDITYTDKVLTIHDTVEIPILIGTNVLKEYVDSALSMRYAQGTLLFDSEREAHKVAKKLASTEYSAVTTDASFKPGYKAVLEVLARGFVFLIAWIIMVFFIAFFINLCSNRTISAFREDMTIMRSMGIPVRVIRIGIYVRMFLSQLPAYILLPIVAYIVYHTPRWNAQLVYLQPIHYAAIYLGMIILMLRVTRKQIRNLFGASVKTSLRGGEDV